MEEQLLEQRLGLYIVSFHQLVPMDLQHSKHVIKVKNNISDDIHKGYEEIVIELVECKFLLLEIR